MVLDLTTPTKALVAVDGCQLVVSGRGTQTRDLTQP